MSDPVETLAIAILGLFIGPALILVFPNRTSWKRVIDGFALVTIGGLCLLELIPTSLNNSGWITLIPLLIGFVGPWYLEEKIKDDNNAILLIAVFLLGLHCLIDGMMLVSPEKDTHDHFENQLSIGVLIHRLPVGLFAFAALKARLNIKIALGSMIFFSVTTYSGFVLGPQFYKSVPETVWSLIQGCVAGGLCHVLLHQFDEENSNWTSRNRLFGSLGVLLGCLILYESGLASLIALLITGPAMTMSITKWSKLDHARSYVAFSFLAAAISFGLEELLHYNGEHDHIPTLFAIPVMIAIGLSFTRMATAKTNTVM